jgi:uncharacterized repeat protein (TIGR01451 family)
MAQFRYGNSIANSNIAVGELLEVLSASKTAVRKTYGQNDIVTYVITIVNAGATALSGITITDNLGAYTFGEGTLVPLTYIADTVKYYVNGVLQTAPVVTGAPSLVISGLTVPANGDITVVYEAEVNALAPMDAAGTITNTAVVTGGGITPITVTETIGTESEPILTITKSVSPVPVTENGTLTYTFLIQNAGSAPADIGTDAVIVDTFNPLLSNLAVSFNGTAWAETTNYTYDETTGVFTTIAGQITVPAATYTQNPVTGVWTADPGVSTLVVKGTI